MRYRNTTKEKENGVVYTPTEMADYVAAEIIKCATNIPQDEIRILDPAIGQGELIVAMIKAVRAKTDARIIVVGYETDFNVCDATYTKLSGAYPDIPFEIRNEDFLTAVSNKTVGIYDFVIANPPYIRTQILGSDKAQEIAETLSLDGRIDIYYAFLVYTKEVLSDCGVAGYITSNKVLTIKAGASVRNFMLENYKLHRITDLGDTKLFTASVLPCILVFSKGRTTDRDSVSYTSVYEETISETELKANSIFGAIYKSGCYKMPDGKKFTFQQGVVQSVEKDQLWNLLSDEIQAWLQKVDSNTWVHFSDIGKIRVGIKTTADNVFIGDDWTGEKADLELLRPLITHRNAGQIVANNNKQWKVLYTHKMDGNKKVAYNINEFPKSKAYLLKHYDQLSGRSYVKKAHRNWYEIWVPQNPASWPHRKIVFRDISEHPEFWIDETGAVVNGDCYWIDINPNVLEDVIYLALAVANSEFIEKYYDVKFNTKLYSGKRRYMSQYVKQFPIPFYGLELAQKAITIVKKIIAENNQDNASSDYRDLNNIVTEMFS